VSPGFGQLQNLPENPRRYQQAAAAASAEAAAESSPAARLSAISARKRLKSRVFPVPGRQPLCATLAGAQSGLEVCFSWGRGQRRRDALTSPVCLLPFPDLAEVEIFDPTQPDAGRRISPARLPREQPPRADSRQRPQRAGEGSPAGNARRG